MLCSGKVSRTFEFLWVVWAAEKNNEKVEANYTGFSAELFGAQSIEMFCFARKIQIQMLTASFQTLTRIHKRLPKSLGLYWVVFGRAKYTRLLTITAREESNVQKIKS